jgi:hypothetical protein
MTTTTDGLLDDQDLKAINQAMGAIQLIRSHYGSSVEGQRLMQDVLKILRGTGRIVCINVADAINCANHMKGVQEAPYPGKQSAA